MELLGRRVLEDIEPGRLTQQSGRQTSSTRLYTRVALVTLLTLIPQSIAQDCMSLSGSLLCPAFPEASISTTNSKVVSFFPFLQRVSNITTFDEQLFNYMTTNYVQEKYQTLFGCDNVDLKNTTDLYARFSTTVICNAIIQNSRAACSLSAAASRPVCAETCAQQAESESMIVANRNLCVSPGNNSDTEIRADFTNCALPANSLASSCIEGIQNEPNNCGFGNSTIGLCQYCASGGLNSTDTCCYTSDAQKKCANVILPSITGFVTFTAPVPSLAQTSKPSATGLPPDAAISKLSHGAIAGIAIGSILGLASFGALIFLFISCLQRRRSSLAGSIFNQPSPSRFNHDSRSSRKRQLSMTNNPITRAPEGYEILPGGRIARMSALESHSNAQAKKGSDLGISVESAGHAKRNRPCSEAVSIKSNPAIRALRPPQTSRRTGSLSSNSALGLDEVNSQTHSSKGDRSSAHGLASQQSEQLPFFKDYYSLDEIRPGDLVATLWAYQPRASDEFTLERGDMLKVQGIWDDGWATGIMIDERAEQWVPKHNARRDSGVSHTFSRKDDSSNVSSEIKAFPLVCVCLPEHWKKTIEGDGSTEARSSLQGAGALS